MLVAPVLDRGGRPGLHKLLETKHIQINTRGMLRVGDRTSICLCHPPKHVWQDAEFNIG